MRILTEITRDDIDNAILANCQRFDRPLTEHCPVAQAFRRLFPPAEDIEVTYLTVTANGLRYFISCKDEDAMLGFTYIPPEEWLRCKPTLLEFSTSNEDRS